MGLENFWLFTSQAPFFSSPIFLDSLSGSDFIYDRSCGGSREHSYSRSVQIIFAQKFKPTIIQTPLIHFPNTSTWVGNTGPGLPNGSGSYTPAVEITLYHIINLTHFTLLIMPLAWALAGHHVGVDIFQQALGSLWGSRFKGLDWPMVECLIPQLLLLQLKGFCQNASGWVSVGLSECAGNRARKSVRGLRWGVD